MSEVDLTQRLDEAIDAMIATGELPSVMDERIADLLGVAIELRQLPRFEFRERLRTELEEEGRMSTAAKPTEQNINPVREGFRTIMPCLIVSDVHAEGEFLKQAFGVAGHIYGLGSQGGFHAEYNIGGSMIMVGGGGEGSQWKGTSLPGAIHLYVEDVDKVYQSAVQAGGTSPVCSAHKPYGGRGAGVEKVRGETSDPGPAVRRR